MTSYKEILEEFIRNRNPVQNSTAAILGTQNRQPANKWDIGGSLGNIADIFANRQLGAMQDKEQQFQDEARRQLPDDVLPLAATEGIFGKDLATLLQNQMANKAKQAQWEQEMQLKREKNDIEKEKAKNMLDPFNKQIAVQDAKDLQKTVGATRATMLVKKDLSNPNSNINENFKKLIAHMYDKNGKPLGNLSVLSELLNRIGQAENRKGSSFTINGVKAGYIYNNNEGKIYGIPQAFKQAGFKVPPDVLAPVEQIMNHILRQYIKSEGIRADQVNALAEVKRMAETLGNLANPKQFINQVKNVFDASYKNAYGQYKSIVSRHPQIADPEIERYEQEEEKKAIKELEDAGYGITK